MHTCFVTRDWLRLKSVPDMAEHLAFVLEPTFHDFIRSCVMSSFGTLGCRNTDMQMYLQFPGSDAVLHPS